jgi:hypothetical protein
MIALVEKTRLSGLYILSHETAKPILGPLVLRWNNEKERLYIFAVSTFMFYNRIAAFQKRSQMAVRPLV